MSLTIQHIIIEIRCNQYACIAFSSSSNASPCIISGGHTREKMLPDWDFIQYNYCLPNLTALADYTLCTQRFREAVEIMPKRGGRG